MNELGIAVLIIFISTYAIISTEKVNRTAMSLLGMAVVGMVLWAGYEMGIEGGITFDELAVHVEWSTILFVMAMMIIVGVAGASGMFQYIALQLSKPSGGNHKSLFRTFIIFTFGISLFFDTTSTMLIMAPLTIEVCKALEIDFKPFLVSESLTCNFASIPSIVGAVPNLVIAGETGLDPGFMFIVFMPLAIILLAVSLPIMTRWYAKSFGTTEAYRVEAVFDIDPTHMIRSERDFYAAIAAIVGLVIGFALGPTLHIEPPLVALLVASILLLMAQERANKFLRDVGWDTVFFLVGLFGLVVALEVTGLINELGVAIGAIIGDNAIFATVFLIWIPAMLSAFLDNLPVSAVLAPIARDFSVLSPVLPLALVFAVNIGGYLFTPLGSPANMVAMGFAEKEHERIPFSDFAKIGTALGLIHLTIGTAWLLGVMVLMG
ncbi:MAG: SLC13 family permease [Candidatus Thorarchaeota archaeon]